MKFSHEITVEAVSHQGSDRDIARAARVSTQTDDSDRPYESLVRRLWLDGHTSPFEHSVLTVRVEAPIFVAREWMRHRTQSYSEVSGRYSELPPKFYVPGPTRKLVQTGKAMDYRRWYGTESQLETACTLHREAAEEAWSKYQNMLDAGIAKEVARNVLPVSIYTSFYATANLNNWFKFLTLRHSPEALHEIRMGAEGVREIIAGHWPVAHDAWSEA